MNEEKRINGFTTEEWKKIRAVARKRTDASRDYLIRELANLCLSTRDIENPDNSTC